MAIPVPDNQDVLAAIPAVSRLGWCKTGGFKVVYEAFLPDGTRTALKLVYLPADEVAKRIDREIRLLESCKSPYVVKLAQPVIGPIVVSGNNYFAYAEEFLDGQNLAELSGAGYVPDQRELAQLAICLLSAVQDLWDNHKAIHRDIKPLNIVKTALPDRPFVLLDLGIAFVLSEPALTQDPASVPGTMCYLAPEMLRPGFRSTIDFRSDLYTVGLTLYEFASGVQPFAKYPDPGILYRKIQTEMPDSLGGLRGDLRQEFRDLVTGLMKKRPIVRPSKLNDIIALLETMK